jgi:hypothetical protein
MNNIYTINYILDKLTQQVCGLCIHLFIRNINAIQIDYIGISKNHQGCGLAKFLFNYVYQFYCQKKILTLECEDNLIGFYNKLDCHLIKLPYNVGCKHNLNIMYRGNNRIKGSMYYKIVKSIKTLNNYSKDKKIKQVEENIIKIVRFKPLLVLNQFLAFNEILPYNNYTKEGIS